jgi:hypothetical protein
MGTDVMLTIAEENTFAELEAIVQRNRWAFVQAGNALAEIRFRRLYRSTHSTFEFYCKERWGFTRRSANQYIAATEVVGNLGTQVPKAPPSFTQARELAVLEPEQQRKVAASIDFDSTPVRELKQIISDLKADGKSGNVYSAPPGEVLPPATIAEPMPESEKSIWMDDLCQQCRERLFPQEAPKQDSAVDVEPIQTPVVERAYVADDAVPADEEIVF